MFGALAEFERDLIRERTQLVYKLRAPVADKVEGPGPMDSIVRKKSLLRELYITTRATRLKTSVLRCESRAQRFTGTLSDELLGFALPRINGSLSESLMAARAS